MPISTLLAATPGATSAASPPGPADPRPAKRILRTAMFALAFSCAAARVGLADDRAIEASGGAIHLMEEHRGIEMMREFVLVDVWPDSAVVECEFHLRNAGEATTVRIGFPCTSSGADLKEPTPFRRFDSWVDGRPVMIRVLPDSARPGDSAYRLWYVQEISFAPRQTRRIRNVYVSELGRSVPDTRWFEYTLFTGSSWFGSIGSADAEIRSHGMPHPILESIRPTPTRVTEREIKWRFRNFEPRLNEGNGAILAAWDFARADSVAVK